jgi:hypothetical protein
VIEMSAELWLLVAYFTSAHGGPTITQFESELLCERAKQVIAEEYWPDAFNTEKSSWTLINSHVASYERTKCLRVK